MERVIVVYTLDVTAYFEIVEITLLCFKWCDQCKSAFRAWYNIKEVYFQSLFFVKAVETCAASTKSQCLQLPI